MTIEQTKWFRMEVDSLYSYAMEWQYTTGFADKAKEHVARMARFRQLDSTTMRKICAKANQKLHRKVYVYD